MRLLIALHAKHPHRSGRYGGKNPVKHSHARAKDGHHGKLLARNPLSHRALQWSIHLNRLRRQITRGLVHFQHGHFVHQLAKLGESR